MKIIFQSKFLHHSRRFQFNSKVSFSLSTNSFQGFKSFSFSTVDKLSNPNQSINTDRNEITKGRIFIRNLAYNTTKEDIEDKFSNYGEIAEVVLPWDRLNNRPVTYGFVQFKDEQIANQILEVGTTTINGRNIFISKPDTRDGEKRPKEERIITNTDNQVVVKNIPFAATETEIKDFFSLCGRIIEIRIPPSKLRPDENRGFAFVKFESDSFYRSALSLNGRLLLGNKVSVLRATPNGTIMAAGKENELIVRNLPYDAQERDLRDFFVKNCGEVVNIRLPTDDSANRGFAFVSLLSKDGVDKALGLSGKDFNGRKIKIELALDNKRQNVSEDHLVPASQQKSNNKSRSVNKVAEDDDVDF